MNERERFRQTLTFGTPDRVPLNPGGPRESTLHAWHQQGLPEDVNWYPYLMQTLGIPYQPPKEERFNLDSAFKMIPTFEEKVIEHRDGHYIVQDWMGAITEISDEFDYTYIRSAKDFVTRKWHRFPVQNRQDWEEKMEWRFDPSHPQRFPENFEQLCEKLNQRDWVFQITVSGPFWQLREWVGFENLCLMMIEQPDLVEDMAETCCQFVLKTLEPILARVQPDIFLVNEDMAYKIHSMISPKMARRFLMPAWKSWSEALRKNGCPVIAVDSDGYVGELIPLWIEAGFNCNTPMEVAAGNDLVAFRQQYGRQMAYTGGIDKRAIAAGGETMRAEVLRVASLLETGGYIPGCDHGVPPDISWPNFVAYTRLLAELTGWL
jgi:uroporphyrinogen-III decarboxylase